jgi:hypothetical protein
MPDVTERLYQPTPTEQTYAGVKTKLKESVETLRENSQEGEDGRAKSLVITKIEEALHWMGDLEKSLR